MGSPIPFWSRSLCSDQKENQAPQEQEEPGAPSTQKMRVTRHPCDQGLFSIFSLFIYFFWCGLVLKSLFRLLQCCFCFKSWLSWPRGMWDHSSPTGDWALNPFIGRWRLNHWPTGKPPSIPSSHTDAQTHGKGSKDSSGPPGNGNRRCTV